MYNINLLVTLLLLSFFFSLNFFSGKTNLQQVSFPFFFFLYLLFFSFHSLFARCRPVDFHLLGRSLFPDITVHSVSDGRSNGVGVNGTEIPLIRNVVIIITREGTVWAKKNIITCESLKLNFWWITIVRSAIILYFILLLKNLGRE